MKNLILLFIVLFVFSCKKEEKSNKTNSNVNQTGVYPDIKSLIENESCKNKYFIIDSDSNFVFVPNIFTPNADGFNDLITIGTNTIIENFEFILKDSLGKTIFYSEDQNFRFLAETITEPEKSQIYTFILTGKIASKDISMNGKISCVGFPWNNPDVIKLKNCLSCQFASCFDPETKIIDTSQSFSVICH